VQIAASRLRVSVKVNVIVVVVVVIVVVVVVVMKELLDVTVCRCRWTSESRVAISTVQKNSTDFFVKRGHNSTSKLTVNFYHPAMRNRGLFLINLKVES